MRRRAALAALASLLHRPISAEAAAIEPFDFVALGDMPYGPDLIQGQAYRQLIDQINALGLPLTIHVGDFKSGKPGKQGNGAIYNQTAPSEFASKAGGEWQTCEATIIGNKITVILNGKKIHDAVECNVATGSELDKLVTEPGALFLQGDHGTVWFRNMRIKELAK